jgi:hypothetical protein
MVLREFIRTIYHELEIHESGAFEGLFSTDSSHGTHGIGNASRAFLRSLSGADLSRGDHAPEGVRTPGPWRVSAAGREAMTRGDFLGD